MNLSFIFELDNSFTFPDGWFLNVNGNISTAAKQSYSLIHREGTVNARLSKSFLEDALMITLTADDIFSYPLSLYGWIWSQKSYTDPFI